MPASTMRVISLPKSSYMVYADLHSCKPRVGSDYQVRMGRNWIGNQSRKRRRFNAPTRCSSSTLEANTSTIHQGMNSCETLPACYSIGPLGPGSGPFGDKSANGSNERRLQSRALARFVSNAGAGITLAETTGTLRSLSDRLSAVVSILNSLRKGNIKGALSTLHQHTGYNTTRAAARLKANPGRNYVDRASNFWLETAFGWTPLLQSVYDSVEVLGNDYRTDRRARASDSRNKMKAGIAANFKTSAGNRFSSLGLINPAEIAWDLVPFSFVLDWFLPIANSIRFLGMRPLVTEIWMWSSRKHGTVNYVGDWLGGPVGTLRQRTTQYVRSVSIPTVTTFTARLPATMWHAVTSAALIQGLRPR